MQPVESCTLYNQELIFTIIQIWLQKCTEGKWKREEVATGLKKIGRCNTDTANKMN